jgi:hypothetical protein
MWQTYTPDNRLLLVQQTASGWLATCGPNRVESPDAAAAIRGAIVGDGTADESLEAWIADHVAQLGHGSDRGDHEL